MSENQNNINTNIINNNNDNNDEYWEEEDQGYGLYDSSSYHGKTSNSEIKIQNKNGNSKIKSIVGKMFNDKKEKTLSKSEQIDKMVQMY